MLIISDNSALSVLAETSMLHLLPAIFRQVTITQSVHRECRDAGAPPELRSWISNPPGWLSIVPDPATLLPEVSSLDEGEAASITLAWEHRPDSHLILDEKRGRRIAKALGLSLTGVLAIIADAANLGLVDFDAALKSLIAADFHVSDDVIAEVRRRLAK
jgi:uncharacterized protein